MILYLAVYHSSQDFKNSDSSSSEDEQEKVVHQEPLKNSMRENVHRIIRDYIYNWKMNLEYGLKKAKDHVLEKSSYAMKKNLEELKELSFLASEFKKIILAANQKRYLIVFDSKRETEGKSKQVLDEILAKLKNKSKLKICAESLWRNWKKIEKDVSCESEEEGYGLLDCTDSKARQDRNDDHQWQMVRLRYPPINRFGLQALFC